MFQSDLVTIKIGKLWQLQEPLIWDDGKIRVVVETNYSTDLASIPKWFWNPIKLFGITVFKGWKPWGKWARAATKHDWLYAHPYTSKDWVYGEPQKLTRWQVDWLFYRAMRSDRVDRATAIVFWLTCVLVGWRWFNSKE